MLLTVKCEMDDTTGAPLEALTPAVISWCSKQGVNVSTVAQFKALSEDRQSVVARAIQAAIDR